MKILEVNKFYDPITGGIERTVQNIAEGLLKEADISVLVCQKKGRHSEEMIHGVPVCRCHSFGTLCSMPISLDFFLQLRKQARDKDVIHFHMPFPLGDLGGLLSGYKGKIVVYWHSDVVKQKRFMVLYRPVMEKFLKRADLILVGAQGIIDGSEYLGPYRDKCKIIPFAVSESIRQDGEAYFRELQKLEKSNKVKFLFVGRLVYYKGCSILLEALKQVENGELDLVGTGELEGELKRFCRELGMEHRVRFWGEVTDDQMKQCFRESDVFVFPSTARSEAFGLVQLEAMAYGKPVINTNLPSGVPDVSLNGVTGLTVEPGDCEALASAMRWLAEHPEERLAYGRAAKKRLEEMFTLERVLPQIYTAYENLLVR